MLHRLLYKLLNVGVGVSVAVIAWSTLLRNCVYSAGVASLFVKTLSLKSLSRLTQLLSCMWLRYVASFAFVASTKCTWLPHRNI